MKSCRNAHSLEMTTGEMAINKLTGKGQPGRLVLDGSRGLRSIFRTLCSRTN